MKLMNKILILMFLLLVLIPLQAKKTSAETVNAVWHKDFEYSPTTDLINPENIFDYTTSTYGKIGYSKKVTITFIQPIKLAAIEYGAASLSWRVLDETGATMDSWGSVNGPLQTRTANYAKPVKSITIYNPSGNNEVISHIVFKIPAPVDHTEISNVLSTVTDKSFSMTWNPPKDNPNFIQTNIYKNGTKIANVAKEIDVWKDDDVLPNTSYTYKLTAVYDDGFETSGVNITDTTSNEQPDPTKIPPSNVRDLAVSNITDTSLELGWVNPDDDDLDKINIYKNGTLLESIPVNSTYKVLGLTPNTSYAFSVSLVDKDGNESSKQKITATTNAEPPPKIEGGSYEKEENGDYTITWEKPTTGEIKVYVGGGLYKTIPANQKSITIPKNDLKYNVFGEPDVKLQPVSESGLEGEEESPQLESIKSPFTVNDLIETGNGLLWYVGPLLLLGLSFLLFPKLRNLVFGSFGKKKEEQTVNQKELRTAAQPKDIQDQEMKNRMDNERLKRRERQELRSQHQGKDHLEKLGRRRRGGSDFRKNDSVEPRKRVERRNREARKAREPRVPREARKRRGE